MLPDFIKEEIQNFVIGVRPYLELMEIIQSIYDTYPHYEQIGYGVSYAIQLDKTDKIQKSIAVTKEWENELP